ncbi:YHS domain-containing (seleno)protein [Polymorphobacter sp.]|uniref:YHS domain-containing (seleno)protein n=1 Tax=Polymorphobacter sp. TaxID=1909290 RepID=UPI003F710258
MSVSRRLMLLAGLALAAPAFGAGSVWTGEDSTAAGGMDVVSYFGGTPVAGDPAHAAEHQGARFLFATAANLAAFTATPGRYLPQYGGHCAWAAAEGRRAGGNPQVWRIVDGKLYFNCSKEAEAKWLADLAGNIAKADEWWAWEASGEAKF